MEMILKLFQCFILHVTTMSGANRVDLRFEFDDLYASDSLVINGTLQMYLLTCLHPPATGTTN